MANINQISPDGGTTVYDIEDPTARSSINSLTPRVGIVEGKVSTLEGQMLSVEDDLDSLGTASTKNSTSVVTESSDLVESGAVKDIVGWGNKNLTDWKWNTFTTGNKLLITLNKGTYTISAQSTLPNGTTFIRGTKQDSSYCSKTELGVDNWTDSSTAGVYATTELLSSYTFSVPEDNVLIEFGRTNCNGTIPAQLEKGSTATAYEPYHASVSDSLAEKADNSVIGTVEDGTNPTKSYAIGEHFIRNGKFCTCIVPVTTASTWSDSYYVEGAVGDKIILTNSGSVTISADSFDTSALTIAIPTGYTPTQCTLYISGSGNARHSSYHPYYDSTNKVVQFVVKNSDTESSHTWGLTGYVDAIKS